MEHKTNAVREVSKSKEIQMEFRLEQRVRNRCSPQRI